MNGVMYVVVNDCNCKIVVKLHASYIFALDFIRLLQGFCKILYSVSVTRMLGIFNVLYRLARL